MEYDENSRLNIYFGKWYLISSQSMEASLSSKTIFYLKFLKWAKFELYSTLFKKYFRKYATPFFQSVTSSQNSLQMCKRTLVSQSYKVTAKANSPDGIEYINSDSTEVLKLPFIFLWPMNQKKKKERKKECQLYTVAWFFQMQSLQQKSQVLK